MSIEEQAKVKLYWLEQSRSQRIVWLLEELKIPYELEIFHRTKAFLAPPELEKIHPLGKSPVISVTPPGENAKPIILAESGFMTQYLCEHFPEGKRLTPTKWREGMEGKVGGETESWLRWQYYLHYCEGSLMPIMLMSLIVGKLKTGVPFFIRPITGTVANRIFSSFLFPNAHKHFAMLEEQLVTSPGGGKYLCGNELTAADILISFPLIAAKGRLNDIGPWKDGSWVKEFPRLAQYLEQLEQEEGYKRSVEKVKEMDGGKFTAAL